LAENSGGVWSARSGDLHALEESIGIAGRGKRQKQRHEAEREAYGKRLDEEPPWFRAWPKAAEAAKISGEEQ